MNNLSKRNWNSKKHIARLVYFNPNKIYALDYKLDRDGNGINDIISRETSKTARILKNKLNRMKSKIGSCNFISKLIEEYEKSKEIIKADNLGTEDIITGESSFESPHLDSSDLLVDDFSLDSIKWNDHSFDDEFFEDRSFCFNQSIFKQSKRDP
ncbi:hypothetical protein TRFO_13363 [Tritrichomonas foetus]|uniref:Uncharacterized protein n=1 Tax=Tritrichomonas foetus TaxID=1144522 RepID=A0A1J4L2L2_9EUKA|nr:hypothetical protein TRFO_13363 [Tritrichomonas foetus]|eukprot:OHT16204.1 hypothetical protein TRFO_13363 [Tritrichomonas foetus]